ncbi:hypothetical protein [Noviherbaspirillum aerium]|uniref:hypothetical protein n=1 Tax=Noviherbaspirillum aerium TaxID=2588497 RepID=UPI00124D53D2|nr:hypothetical protein [Noviherbaspirillum aerium]
MTEFERRKRAATRATMRAQLGLDPRADDPTPPQATASSSPQPYQDNLPILLSITGKNKHAIATQALQRAIGTRPGFANEIQQRGWVGLLGRTLQAYDDVEMARKNQEPEEAVQRLEDEMRNSLRELLHVSSRTNVFNFEIYASPELDEDLDAFISRPEFRTLVETVTEVHQQLEQQRHQLGNRVAFASSSGDTYADQGGTSSRQS